MSKRLFMLPRAMVMLALLASPALAAVADDGKTTSAVASAASNVHIAQISPPVKVRRIGQPKDVPNSCTIRLVCENGMRYRKTRCLNGNWSVRPTGQRCWQKYR